MKLFSIVIPSINSRAQLLDQLLLRFNNLLNVEGASLQGVQKFAVEAAGFFSVYDFGAVEIITAVDAKGEHHIGDKRTALTQHASGRYVANFDDDDEPTDDYFLQYRHMCKMEILRQVPPDCYSLRGIMTTNGQNPEIFEHSLKYRDWRTNENPGADVKYERTPNHLNAILKKHAVRITYPSLSHGEDHDFSRQLQAADVIKSEHYIPEPIYKYKFIPGK